MASRLVQTAVLGTFDWLVDCYPTVETGPLEWHGCWSNDQNPGSCKVNSRFGLQVRYWLLAAISSWKDFPGMAG